VVTVPKEPRQRGDPREEVVFDVAGPLAGRRSLDVGCGDGLYTIECARPGTCVTGVDISGPMLVAAKQRTADHSVDADLVLSEMRHRCRGIP
jgi:2-polyprenyl-3-methyl-5-hydroxy-6-metoxy-1,4-benzoquinol methylase